MSRKLPEDGRARQSSNLPGNLLAANDCRPRVIPSRELTSAHGPSWMPGSDGPATDSTRARRREPTQSTWTDSGSTDEFGHQVVDLLTDGGRTKVFADSSPQGWEVNAVIKVEAEDLPLASWPSSTNL